MATADHARLLPSVLVPDEPGRTRSRRDWVVDTAMFVLAIGFGFLFWGGQIDQGLSGPLREIDVVIGLALCLGLWVRRRWPLGLGLVSVPVIAVSSFAGAAGAAILFTVAVHRRWPAAVLVAALQLAGLPIYFALQPEDSPQPWIFVILIVVATAAIVAWGMFVRSRRELVESLRARVRQAEAEQQLRAEQVRQAERTRIAREMHDVLAHRISLLSLHAGALEFRPDASPEEVARAAGVIRASAHQALEDLRTVIGVLRDGADGAAPEPPQPTLAALPELLEESRAAGMEVDADIRVADLGAVPDAIGRHALRIVQEALTNARKHGHDGVDSFGRPAAATVRLRMEGEPGKGLTIEVRNRASVLATGGPEIPGAGTGLIGLAERAVLSGGRLEHGLDAIGDFSLRAWLPWRA